ncbi:hypothetical protein IMX07_08820 [bacterium]|nr:hypothetical protein [bacterium]
MLAEIEAATDCPTPGADLAATVARLEARNAELRAVIRQLQIDKRNIATENLSLLYRARLAEDRLCNRDREIAAHRLVSGEGACIDHRSIESRNCTSRIDPRSQRV